MIRSALRNGLYFVVFALIQVLVLNNIHFLRITTPFLYVYAILKLPVDSSRSRDLCYAFFLGLVIDLFTNTPGMHTAACTLVGFCREPLTQALVGKEIPKGLHPSADAFGWSVFMRYALIAVSIHHVTLFSIESLALYAPPLLLLRIALSLVTTLMLIAVVEIFNVPDPRKHGE